MSVGESRFGVRWAMALVLVLTGLAIAGCGGDAEGDSEQTYGEVLRGLERAALAGKSYGAVGRAEGLKAAERNALTAFCEFAREIALNREAWKLPQHAYVVNRIRSSAYSLGDARFDPLNEAMGTLYKATNITNFDPKLLKRYQRACYR